MSRKLVLVAIAASLSGCASMAVTDDIMGKRTAIALGLDRDDFTISNRSDSALRIDYVATTKTGRVFNCYISGQFGMFGREVTDAMCTEKGKMASKPFQQG